MTIDRIIRDDYSHIYILVLKQKKHDKELKVKVCLRKELKNRIIN